MTDEQLLELMRRVDPMTKRLPPGVRLIANAVEAAERERCAKLVLTYFGVKDDYWGDGDALAEIIRKGPQ